MKYDKVAFSTRVIVQACLFYILYCVQLNFDDVRHSRNTWRHEALYSAVVVDCGTGLKSHVSYVGQVSLCFLLLTASVNCTKEYLPDPVDPSFFRISTTRRFFPAQRITSETESKDSGVPYISLSQISKDSNEYNLQYDEYII